MYLVCCAAAGSFPSPLGWWMGVCHCLGGRLWPGRARRETCLPLGLSQGKLFGAQPLLGQWGEHTPLLWTGCRAHLSICPHMQGLSKQLENPGFWLAS